MSVKTFQSFPCDAVVCTPRLTVHSCSDGVSGLVDENTGVIIELDDRTIRALHFLGRADDDGMANVSSANLVCDTDVVAAVGAEISLLLDHDHDAVTCSSRNPNISVIPLNSEWKRAGYRTNGGGALLLQDIHALDNGGAGVVDAVKHCLDRGLSVRENSFPP